jgi:threonine dehydrogenase-like Zn-dependent dehydrogenase
VKAVCWHGAGDVRVETVGDPRLLAPRDAIVKVTLSAICGSDLHLYGGFIPTARPGDILGHEFMGEVVEVGSEVTNLRPGERVVVPFAIACGRCFFCQRGMTSLCDDSNPNGWITEKLYGHPAGGLFGYSHMMGGYAGGQAQYVRVPYADFGPLKLENGVADESALLLSDVLPTAYMAAENCGLAKGDTVAVWGCGPVGLLCIKCALLLGAERVIAIDRIPDRLAKAEETGAETIDYQDTDVVDALKEMTFGLGPDACIDAVGLEAHGRRPDALYDRAKQMARLQLDRATVLRQAIQACRKGGVVSVPGVYGGFVDKIPLGALFAKGLTLKTGQTHVHRYMKPLLERIQRGEIDPAFVVTHRIALEDAPRGYEMFRAKEDGCVKVVLRP